MSIPDTVLHDLQPLRYNILRAQMQGFAFDRLGAKFSNRENVRIALRRFNLRMPRRLAPDGAYICWEYTAGCYKAVGLGIQWDGRGFIATSNIADDPGIAAVAQIRTKDTPGPKR